MYKDLINKLRELPHLLFVQLGEHEDVVYQAADAIEVLDMKLQGANAAIAGMQREIERMVIDSANIKPQWIPVAARLPEKDIEVLVFAEGKIEGFFGDTAIAISKRYDFKIFTDSEGVEVWQSPWQYFLTDYEITHWMPLPQPPVEGI